MNTYSNKQQVAVKEDSKESSDYKFDIKDAMNDKAGCGAGQCCMTSAKIQQSGCCQANSTATSTLKGGCCQGGAVEVAGTKCGMNFEGKGCCQDEEGSEEGCCNDDGDCECCCGDEDDDEPVEQKK